MYLIKNFHETLEIFRISKIIIIKILDQNMLWLLINNFIQDDNFGIKFLWDLIVDIATKNITVNDF